MPENDDRNCKDTTRDLSIVAALGYTPEVGRLISMMSYARTTTLHAVDGLSIRDLDHRHDERSNSIGALLAHVAAIEWVYQIQTFESRDPSADETAVWGPALDLGPAARKDICGNPLSHYIEQLESVRAKTLELFRGVDDDWLDQRDALGECLRANRYWQWFHVYEDELNHRGQIRWLRSRLPADQTGTVFKKAG